MLAFRLMIIKGVAGNWNAPKTVSVSNRRAPVRATKELSLLAQRLREPTSPVILLVRVGVISCRITITTLNNGWKGS